MSWLKVWVFLVEVYELYYQLPASLREKNSFEREKHCNKTNKAKIHTIKAVSQSSMAEKSKLLIACETTGLRGKKKKKPPLLDCKYCLVFLNVSGVIHIPRDGHEGFSGWHPRVSCLASHSTPRVACDHALSLYLCNLKKKIRLISGYNARDALHPLTSKKQ